MLSNMLQCLVQPAEHAETCAGMKVAVVGGSLGGLAAANVLSRLGAAVTVFEKSAHGFAQRGACLGFVDVQQLQRICGGVAFMRNGAPASLAQGAFYYGDVWRFLAAGLPKGCLKLGQVVGSLGEDPRAPSVAGEVFDLVVVADGGWSGLRARYFDDRRPEYTGHQIIWASVDTAELSGGLASFDCAFGATETATYTTGIYDAVVLEAPKCDGSSMYACGFFIATPESEILPPETGDNRQVQATRAWSRVPDWFLPFIRRWFGEQANGEIVRFAEAAASKGKISPNPVFEYAAPKTVAGRIVLLGDAAHLSTPWTAAGAHTAILDAVALGAVLASGAFQRGGGNIDAALQVYNKGGVQRANKLLRQSQACSKRLIPRAGKQAVPSPSTLL